MKRVMKVSRLAHGSRTAITLLSLIAAGTLLSFGCTADFASQSEADVILRIVSVEGHPGSTDVQAGNPLISDVCCAITNDNATLTFDLISKNRNANTVVGPFNDVQLERYEIHFIRSDGHNVEGVDVPFSISAGLSGFVVLGAQSQAIVVVVRHQAKLEPPLRNLHGHTVTNTTLNFGGEGIITTTAEITVHGRTGTGRAVEARTFLEVVFADFAGEG